MAKKSTELPHPPPHGNGANPHPAYTLPDVPTPPMTRPDPAAKLTGNRAAAHATVQSVPQSTDPMNGHGGKGKKC